MKNLNLILVIVLLFILPICLKTAIAESVPGIPDVITNLPEDPSELPDKATTYLKQEWAKLISKQKFIGPIFVFFDSFLTALDPFFKIVLGMPHTISWSFFFALAIWFILFYLIVGPSMDLMNNKLYGYIAGFCITSLIGLSGTIKWGVDLLNKIITNKWIAIISALVAVLLLFFAIQLEGGFNKALEKDRLNTEKTKTAKAQKIIQAQGEIAKKELKS